MILIDWEKIVPIFKFVNSTVYNIYLLSPETSHKVELPLLFKQPLLLIRNFFYNIIIGFENQKKTAFRTNSLWFKKVLVYILWNGF